MVDSLAVQAALGVAAEVEDFNPPSFFLLSTIDNSEYKLYSILDLVEGNYGNRNF